MSGFGIANLPLPPRRYRLHKISRKEGGASEVFETREAALREDMKRIRALKRSARYRPQCSKVNASFDLAKKIESAASKGSLAKSLASARYMRKYRIRVVGWLWQLSDDDSEFNVRCFTLISSAWVVPADKLKQFDPDVILVRLRADLYRCGAGSANGWLFCGVHGEFDEIHRVYRLHVHGIAAGEMLEVLKQLRRLRKFRSSPRGGALQAIVPVHINRRPPANISASISYCLQSFWPARTYEDWTGSSKRTRRRRIPEPWHCAYLQWLDQQTLNSMTLLVGLRATKSGFIPTR